MSLVFSTENLIEIGIQIGVSLVIGIIIAIPFVMLFSSLKHRKLRAKAKRFIADPNSDVNKMKGGMEQHEIRIRQKENERTNNTATSKFLRSYAEAKYTNGNNTTCTTTPRTNSGSGLAEGISNLKRGSDIAIIKGELADTSTGAVKGTKHKYNWD